jgi:rhodanese-related sulfurtransferase
MDPPYFETNKMSIEEFDKKDKIWILYCKRGSLSFKLANEMNKVGYKVKAVVGGFKKI